MTTNTASGQKRTDTDARDERALQQYLTVLPETGRARGAPDLFLVVSESGSEYLVDTRVGACECPDHEYRGVECKHLKRVAFATGDEPIPAGVEGVDDQLGAHVEGAPVATDGGVVTAAERPDDCACSGHPDEQFPCWYCYADGHDEPNPDAKEGE